MKYVDFSHYGNDIIQSVIHTIFHYFFQFIKHCAVRYVRHLIKYNEMLWSFLH